MPVGWGFVGSLGVIVGKSCFEGFLVELFLFVVIWGLCEHYFLFPVQIGSGSGSELGCFLLFVFGFFAGVFGALPPFPTSFLQCKKEAKKTYTASPFFVFRFSLLFPTPPKYAPHDLSPEYFPLAEQ